ncbi:MAG: DUF4129 domain-containing protein [Chloroflexi bacterium]|nr:DUF4129 domain-containing protein [Chloroflexota bacterium]
MRRLRWVPVGLAVVAEAAWVAVVAGFAQELVLREPAIGLAGFVAAVAGGVVAARLVGVRLARRWPPLALALAFGASIVGLFVDPAARAALAEGGTGPGAAIGANPGGLLIGLAVIRGYSHAGVPLGEDRLVRLLFGGTVAISLLGLVGGLIAEPYRSRFEGDAMTATLVFAGCAVLALALTRLTVVGAGSGADWPKNPVWVGLLVSIVALVLLAAAPAVGLVRPAVEIAFAILLGPLIIAGLLFGWTRGSIQALLVVLLLGAAAVTLLPLLGSGGGSGSTTPGSGLPGGPSTPPPPPDPAAASIGVILLAIVGAIVLLLLIRAWMRSATIRADSVIETRTIDHGDEEIHRPRRSWRPFRAAPSDAAAAYRSLLADLAGRPIVARATGETPREHARRLRGDGWGRVRLELLAADYELERFAGVPLTPVEHRRAIDRWRRLRSDLRPVVPPSPEELRPARRDRGPGSGRDAEDLASRLRARDELDR